MKNDFFGNIVIVLANQRSGTKALGSTLSTIKGVSYFGESFHDEESSEASFWNFFQKEFIANPSPLTEKYLETILDNYFYFLYKKGENITFADIMYNNLNMISPMWRDINRETFILEYIKKRGINIIHLVRENLFECYLSIEIAKATAQFHSHTGDISIESKINVDKNSMLDYVESKLYARKAVDASILKYKNSARLSYEKCFSPDGFTQHCVDKLHDLLDIPKNELISAQSIYKKGKIAKDAVIDNYNELNTVYESFLRGLEKRIDKNT